MRRYGLLTLLVLAVAGCALPRIIFLHDPLTADEHVELGARYESQKKCDLATREYTAALESDRNNPPALTGLGNCAAEATRWEEAEEYYRRVLASDPEAADVLNNLAWVLLHQGKALEEAEAHVEKALQIKPAHTPYYRDTLGLVYARRNDHPRALTEFLAALDLSRHEETTFRAEIYGHLAEVYHALGRGEEARQARRKAEEMRVSSPPQSGARP